MPYTLKSVRAPKLRGRALKSLVAALDSPLTRRFIEYTLLREAGLPRFRSQPLDTPPLMQPVNLAATGAPIGQPPARVLDALLKAPLPTRLPGILGFHAAYREGRTTPSDVAERLIARLEELDRTPFNPVVFRNDQNIRAQARESTQRWQRGRPLSLLDGVPVAVKDELDLVPYATTAGTRVFGQDGSAQDDATACARLRQAGALFIGKTHMHEIGMGVTGHNTHYGPARNPWDMTRYTGGSSSGSAAAVALGLCPVALGADGGGSIRIPAALCGISGLKPTWGRISEHGAFPLCPSVAHIGPMGLTADDLAIVYSLIAGPDVMDSHTLHQPPVTLDLYPDLRGLRIGIYTPWFSDASPEVVQACQLGVERMKQLGAEVHAVMPEDLDNARVAHAVTIASEMLASVWSAFQRTPEAFGMETRLNLAMARAFTAADYVRAQQVRQQLMDTLNNLFQQVDLLVTPTTGITAPPIPESALPDGESDLKTLTALMRFAFVGNLSGIPALTLPVGQDGGGLPVGLQLMASHWQESRLLAVARCLMQDEPAPAAPGARSLLTD